MAIITGSTTNAYWTFKLEATQGNQSIENNTSQVTVEAFIGRGASSGGSYLEGGKFTVTLSVAGCEDQKFTYDNTGKTITISQGGWQTLGSKTFTVTHTADGSKTATVSGKFTRSIGAPSGGSASGIVSLTTIPRASSPSAISAFSIGEKKTISITRASTSFTHDVYCLIGSVETLIEKNVGNSCIWDTGTWDDGLLWKKTANGSSSTYGMIKVYTFNGSSLLGHKETPFTATVPAQYKGENVQPSLSCLFSPSNSPSGFTNLYIATKSKIRADFSGSHYNSGIGFAEVSFSVNGKKYSSKDASVLSIESDTLLSEGTFTIDYLIKDSSGRTASLSTKIPVVSYYYPKVKNVECYRVAKNDNGVWAQKQLGTGVLIKAAREYSNNISGNACSLRYEVYSGNTRLKTGDLTDNTPTVISDYTFETGKAYTVKLIVADRIESRTYSYPITTASPVLHGNKGGTGLGVGMQVPDGATGFHVAFDATFYGEVGGTVYGLGKLPPLPAGTDVDTWLNFGAYSVRTNEIARTIINLPSEEAGVFRVWSSVGDGSNSGTYFYIIQEYTTYTNSAIYRRYISAEGVRSWKSFALQ